MSAPSQYEMGIEFVPRYEAGTGVDWSGTTLDGYSVYSSCEGESPTFQRFFTMRDVADGFAGAKDNDGEPLLFEAFVFRATLIPEGVVTENDCTLDNHEQLRERIEQYRQKGGVFDD